MNRWQVGVADNGSYFIQDNDFRHDARLYLNGDFADAEQKRQFAEQAAFALNKEFGWDLASGAARAKEQK